MLLAYTALMSTPTKPLLHLIIGTYTGSPAEIARLTDAHRTWQETHYRSGLFLVSGRQDPPVGGVLLARGTPEQLHALMQDDPFTRAGVATYQILSFQPAKRSADFPYPEIDPVT